MYKNKRSSSLKDLSHHKEIVFKKISDFIKTICD